MIKKTPNASGDFKRYTTNIMNIDFGTVSKYFTDRGFGFVSGAFYSANSKDVFFHIRNIKIKHPKLANKLAVENYSEVPYFWYEIEATKKGKQVGAILNPESLNKKYANELPLLIEKVECIWRDIDSELPNWLNQATIDLVGTKHTHNLITERDALEIKKEKENEKLRKEAEARREIKRAEDEKRMAECNRLKAIKGDEFKQLIEEMKPLGFTRSSQLSLYIMSNHLGYKYKNISGVVEMEQDGRRWDFKGGFPPEIYSQICRSLGLDNQGSLARVVSFNSFEKLS